MSDQTQLNTIYPNQPPPPRPPSPPSSDSQTNYQITPEAESQKTANRERLASFLILLSGFAITYLAFAHINNLWPWETIFNNSINAKTPKIVRDLCSAKVSKSLSVDSIKITFQPVNPRAYSCDYGIWRVTNGSSFVETSYYFDSQGRYLDHCNQIEHPSGCNTYGSLLCDNTVNFCR
ncbi:MAG: hypothetical protein COV29_02415 [Candidatus Yanofskybacteria bacterium CG10_big_fil_rev_8_21_14_0_10_36_16]|uniref:Uncharacterized protein n=1 Tax=Candidatus Yanofskybacteria bacterium CG10_big_fil_rev_8_21_14_0_10_36_16 TaxID=1975096 RepID=A0A2J0Q7R8_9BACT|nr:MAG: hypothetical protein COV29_02415 [Candidatus Yanofskybacteria bacterium CG10_big_fil_rev_8_21_14_0_10_36_16]